MKIIAPKKDCFSHLELKEFLQKKNSKNQEKFYKNHINHCKVCWEAWNKVRWDEAINSQGINELREYLKDDFQLYYDSSWALANEWYKQNPKTEEEITAFYKNTKNYLYNSTVFYESGDRPSFKSFFEKFLKENKITSVIDYGCGVGNDGLVFLEKGLKVYFCDFDSPSTDFLKWRLSKRNYKEKTDYEIIDVEKNENLPEADLLWTIDVIEHMVNPTNLIDKVDDLTKFFIYYSDDDDKAGGRHPFHFLYNKIKFKRKLLNKGFTKNNSNMPHLNIWQKKD